MKGALWKGPYYIPEHKTHTHRMSSLTGSDKVEFASVARTSGGAYRRIRASLSCAHIKPHSYF